MRKLLITACFIACTAAPTKANDQLLNADEIAENIRKGEYGTITSALVMKDGNIIFEGYFNGADPNSLHNTRSVTKTITSMAVGAAVDDDLMTVETPAASFFTDIEPFDNPDPRKYTMTIEDLITMSGTLECNDSDNFSRGTEARMHNVEDWASFFWDLPIRGYPGWSEKPSTAKYGRVFAYCSAGVEMAGYAVERAAKTTFQQYVKTKFFDPMGITDFNWQENGLGQAHKSGGLSLTARGLAKFAEMQRNAGIYGGTQILSKSWTEESVKPRVVAYQENQTEYGYLWWLSPYEIAGEKIASYYMSGNGGNRVAVMPAIGLTIVVTKTDYNQRGTHQKTNAFIEKEILSRLIK